MLTDPQLAALKADLIANAASFPPGWYADEIARLWYNQPASPAFYCWTSLITMSEVLDRMDDNDWSQFDNLTAGQYNIWTELREAGGIKAYKSSNRKAVTECWKGTAAKALVATHILDMCKRTATRAEKLFATGTGTVASPATSAFSDVFQLTYQDVEAAQQYQG